jgi:hypothetical protein
MISQRALVSAVAGARIMLEEASVVVGPRDSMLSYLTLAHCYGRVMEETFFTLGMRVGYWRVGPFFSFFLTLSLSALATPFSLSWPSGSPSESTKIAHLGGIYTTLIARVTDGLSPPAPSRHHSRSRHTPPPSNPSPSLS